MNWALTAATLCVSSECVDGSLRLQSDLFCKPSRFSVGIGPTHLDAHRVLGTERVLFDNKSIITKFILMLSVYTLEAGAIQAGYLIKFIFYLWFSSVSSIRFPFRHSQKKITKFQWIIIIIFRWMAARMAVTSWSFHWFGLALWPFQKKYVPIYRNDFSLSLVGVLNGKTNVLIAAPIPKRAHHSPCIIWYLINGKLDKHFIAYTGGYARYRCQATGGSFSVESFIG